MAGLDWRICCAPLFQDSCAKGSQKPRPGSCWPPMRAPRLPFAINRKKPAGGRFDANEGPGSRPGCGDRQREVCGGIAGTGMLCGPRAQATNGGSHSPVGPSRIRTSGGKRALPRYARFWVSILKRATGLRPSRCAAKARRLLLSIAETGPYVLQSSGSIHGPRHNRVNSRSGLGTDRGGQRKKTGSLQRRA